MEPIFRESRSSLKLSRLQYVCRMAKIFANLDDVPRISTLPLSGALEKVFGSRKPASGRFGITG